MPRVYYVKSARKKNPVAEIGESYYHWSFRYGGKQYSKTKPNASQLTQSPFLSQLYDLQETIDNVSAESAEELQSQVEEIAQGLEALREECQSGLDNMPEQLQDSSILNQRIEALDEAIDSFGCIDFSYDEPTDNDVIFEMDFEEEEPSVSEIEKKRDELYSDWIEEKIEEIQTVSIDCE